MTQDVPDYLLEPVATDVSLAVSPDTPTAAAPGQGYVEALRTIRAPGFGMSGALPYRDFRATLTPRFGEVLRDIAAGHLGLWGSVGLLAALEWHFHNPLASVVVAVVGAIAIGFFVTYINLFTHEATHYGLAADRARNDRLANWLIGLWVGTEIATYRPVHWEHHRLLGQINDTERSYFHALTTRWLLEGLTGVHPLRVVLYRLTLSRSGTRDKAQTDAPKPSHAQRNMLLATATCHAACLFVWGYWGLWGVLAAWLGGMGLVFPLLTALRQLLEHRRPDASDTEDFTHTTHGPLARMFGAGLFARWYGGAGFNYHLLHHWEPTVSYTRLPDLDGYLRQTSVSPYLAANTTTYAQAFKDLYRL